MKTILTPIDSSAVSNEVVSTARELAKAMNARIVLITIVQPPVFTSEYAAVMENIAEVVEIGEKAAERQLTKVKERLASDGLVVETAQFNGSPVIHITEQAEAQKADLIVMGSHGHTAFYDLLVGSTTHGVMKRARCPVVIVPPAENTRRKSSAS